MFVGILYEAFDLGVLQHGKDVVVVNKDRQIAEAEKTRFINGENRLHPTYS